jgi:hypothetical protein
MGRPPDSVGREAKNPKSAFFILDDKEEARDWGTIQLEVRLVVRSLTTMLDSLHDIVALVGQV